jgi:tetratricopeptide (TPR) repeat protein
LSYQPAHHASHVAGFGEDAGVTGGAYLSWVLWYLGFPDQARQSSAQTLTLARRLGHPYSLAYALTFAAILHCRLRQPETALTLAQETLELATRHGFSLWRIGATLVRGWALAMQNQPEGVESMQQCVAATRAAMGGVTLVVLGPLADACVTLGRHQEALRVIAEALEVAQTLGDRHIEAELHRLKGESLLGLGDETQAAACFQQALAVSRQQQAKSLELRAATSLARLWHKQGQRDQAARLLEEIRNGFNEGYDTPDQRDARELLDTLK